MGSRTVAPGEVDEKPAAPKVVIGEGLPVHTAVVAGAEGSQVVDQPPQTMLIDRRGERADVLARRPSGGLIC
ncbi:hypothetical protein ACFY6U_00320 [Streptomyces sp. NPDC013157]|uniref:hypothetical protein n=1 Tax=Streptomyces sp. NPDC013157 TaxID=3364861 RepID=UPI0036C2DCFB